MDLKNIIQKVKASINQLKCQGIPSFNLSETLTLEFGEKEAELIKEIVECFNKILSDKYINKNLKSSNFKLNKNNYWGFIASHFNNPLLDYCRTYDKKGLSDNIIGGNSVLTGEIWIFLSILEKTFHEIINAIYKQHLDEKYYEENSLLRKHKEEIKTILNELKDFQFINIKNKDYEQYQEYLKKNNLINKEHNINNSLHNSFLSDFQYDSDDSILIVTKERDFTVKYKNYSMNRKNDFYTFNNKNDNIIYMIDNVKVDIDIDLNISNISEISFGSLLDLKLNPKTPNFLPTDNLYEINENKQYKLNDKIIYNKRVRHITNCMLLYLNQFYKKAPYHKFYKHNLHNKPITLKQQNYQCYTCYKKFSLFLNIPIKQIFWCSYYMRFVCKDCIDNDYSIIPYFVLKKWCFEKFSISKKAKNILLEWYNRPIIYFKKTDELLYKTKQLNRIIEIKRVINNIFDIMKCKNKFKIIEDILGEYKYIALKEYLFSMKDLAEIYNAIFYDRIIEFKNKFVKHISGECQDCKFEGQICGKCRRGDKIYFYDFKNVYYCKKCRKSFHMKCIGIGHIH